MDGAVVVLGGERPQGVPLVGVQLDDLHEEGARELRLGRAQHLIAGRGQQVRHHLGELVFQQAAGALQLGVGGGGW